MHPLSISYLTLPVACLWAVGWTPSRWANRHVAIMCRLVTTLAGLQCVAALVYALDFMAAGGGAQHALLWGASDDLITASLYYDGATSLMLLLVSFVGWIICRFSIRYLDGEASQGRYFRWTAFTIGSVSWMILSGNLLMFFAAWVATSLGLHQLLLHYGQRPAARRAAWTKFAISRLGDVALLGSLVLTYAAFRTFDFADLFALTSENRESVATSSASVHWIGWLLVLGAVTKSAQLPFHSWLPQTMETPTPVSALMHAGIVNAGGYLVIRTSPLISLTPSALVCLAIVGAATACFASVVMLTQTSVKRSLAYSTIAQMGFMMLQCGLGAFSAAMLHILAHSLYKAHAFLGSGGVLTQRSAMAGGKLDAHQGSGSGWRLVLAAGLTAAAFSLAMIALGLDLTNKPGGLVLGFIFCLALTAWLWQNLSGGRRGTQVASILLTGSLALTYLSSYYLVARIVGSNPALPSGQLPSAMLVVIVALGFVSLFLLQTALSRNVSSPRLAALYVHAMNGFYIDAMLRRAARTVLAR